MRIVCGALAAGLTILAPSLVSAERPTAIAVAVEGEAIQIDGRLNEPVWARASWVSGFVQRDPIEGAAATERTDVAFAFDDHALFVGARLFSADPNALRTDVTRRDTESQSESLAISLDTYLDRRTAYTFVVTAAGVRLDYYHARDDANDRDYSFDPVWDARVVRTPDGWTAEMRIPFSQLRFRARAAHTWGLNVRRRTPARNEDAYWVLIGKNDTGWASRFGDLTGIRGIVSTRRVEVLPYVASGASVRTASDAANPLEPRLAGVGRVGADLRMGLGPALTLEAAVNPDFGQVELDPAEVNLSAFESVFSERRPFFTEGSQLLRGGDASYFYSRRIGSAPVVPVAGAFVARPENATILGAAKITGRLPSGLSIGALSAVTGAEDTRRVLEGNEAVSTVRTTPLTSFGIVRLQQQFGASASTAGFVVTHVNRSMDANHAAATILAQRAITGSVDWNLRFRRGEYELRGDLGFSHVSGEPAAIARLQRSSARYFQRPDATHVRFDPTRTSLSGYRGIFEVRKNSGRHWLWNAQYIGESPGFELNDAGRIAGVDSHYVNANLTYRETTPGPVFRQWSINLFADTFVTIGGERDRVLNALNVNMTWRDFSQTTWHYHHELPGQSPTLTRGGPLMATPFFWDAFVRHTTNPARRVSGSIYALHEESALGRRGIDLRPGLSLRPGPRWTLSSEVGYSGTTSPRQYVTELAGGRDETFNRRYVFSALRRREVYLRMRVNYTLSPDMSLETYVEPFASTGRYDAFGELLRPRSHDLRTYGTEGTSIAPTTGGRSLVTDGTSTFTLPNLDFTVRSLRSNAVLRWEWRPGSTLFVVWQQDRGAREPRSAPVRPGALWRALSTEGTHRLLVKATYWVSR